MPFQRSLRLMRAPALVVALALVARAAILSPLLVASPAHAGDCIGCVIQEVSGKVGIGTTGPVQALTVVGNNGNASPGSTANFSSNLGTANTAGLQVNITNTTSSWGLIAGFDGSGVGTSSYHGPNSGYVVNVQGGPLNFGTSNAVNMTINSSGNVGINTTNPSSYTLQVNGSVAGTSAYNNTSDVRLKKDIEPIHYGLDTVLKLRPVGFNWIKQDQAWRKQHQIGLIAQEVEPVVPEVVTTASDAMQTKSLAYGSLVPVLIKAVQEQQAQIQTLTARVDALEAARQ